MRHYGKTDYDWLEFSRIPGCEKFWSRDKLKVLLADPNLDHRKISLLMQSCVTGNISRVRKGEVDLTLNIGLDTYCVLALPDAETYRLQTLRKSDRWKPSSHDTREGYCNRCASKFGAHNVNPTLDHHACLASGWTQQCEHNRAKVSCALQLGDPDVDKENYTQVYPH